jgi:hypothetical protein
MIYYQKTENGRHKYGQFSLSFETAICIQINRNAIVKLAATFSCVILMGEISGTF